MFIKNFRQIKRILVVLFLVCFFVLCSCNDTKEPPIQETYSIIYVINGHGVQPENLTGQTNLPDPLPTLTEEGWGFRGWFKDNDTFEVGVLPNEKLEEDIILYARWIELGPVKRFFPINYEIDNSMGRLEGETIQNVEEGKDGTPVTVIPKLGYKFLGWIIDEGEPRDVDKLTRVEKNVRGAMFIKAVLQGPYVCEMKFRAKEGGKVEGTLEQTVIYGGQGKLVTAIPDEGFRFVRWSDGETEAIRTNEYVTHDPSSSPTIYAEFERYKRKFKLNYNEATSNMDLKEYTFYIDDMDKEQYLPVPKRDGFEFMGWYSDWFHTIQVTDETGKIIVNETWFTNNNLFYEGTNRNMELFVKWKPIKEVPTYKILLIFVTEIHASLETTYYGTVQVDYVMSDLERECCQIVAKKVEEYLEGILNSTVDFQVDSYYTKTPLNEDSFYRGTTGSIEHLYDDFGIDLERGQIPEVNDILDDYGSVLTSFCLNDYDGNKLHATAGSAEAKYGDIHLEYLFSKCFLENMFDYGHFGLDIYYTWLNEISTYIHEFAHTVEMQLSDEDNYGLHNAISYFGEQGVIMKHQFECLYGYLRNEFSVGDRNVGIPYEFWTGEYFKE